VCDLVLDRSAPAEARATAQPQSIAATAEPSHHEDAKGEEVRA
jgi:hypothetical protein